ncbi:MAG: hypothetical protein ACRC5Q_06265 [Culicoidibacterales bacterium]
MNLKFPTNYFVSFVQPAKIYEWRQQYSWPKLIILLLFTIAFTFLPVSLIFLNMTSFNLEMFIPNTIELISPATQEQLEACTFTDATLQCPTTEIVTDKGIVAINPTQMYTITGSDNSIQVEQAANTILFLTEELILTDENGVGFRIQYPEGLERLAVTTTDEVKAGIGELWYSQYRPVAVPILMFAVIAMLFMTVGIYLGFVALILYMMKFSRMVEIDSFKEALAMVIIATGLPTMLGVGIALFTQDIAVLLTVQSFGMIILLLIAYFMTHFKSPHTIAEDQYEKAFKEKK